MNNIIIRKIADKEVPAVVDIWYKASLQAHEFIPSEYWSSNKAQMRKKFIPMSETYVATNGLQILGFISLIEEYLAAIFVKPEFQGLGIGSSLMSHAKSYRNDLQLKVFCKNRKSVDFYLSKGFTIISESKDVETGEKEFIMQWHKCDQPQQQT